MAEVEDRPRDGRARRDEGLALLMVAGGMVALLVVAALVVDIGYAKQMRREAQASADAAALAAAQVMSGSGTEVDAATAARDIADTNLGLLSPGLWPGCTDPSRPGNYTVPSSITSITGGCVSFDSTNRLVRVALPPVDSPSFFGRVIDRDGYEVTATASALWEQGGTAEGDCGLCIIEDGRLQISGGGGSINVPKGIKANRLTNNAQGNMPRTSIQALPIGWYYDNNSNWNKADTGVYTKLPAPVANPYGDWDVDYTGVTVSQQNINSCADVQTYVKPNVMFTQNVNINGCAITLAPGAYYFSGTLNVNNSSVYGGSGVTLVFGCATNNRTAPAHCDSGRGEGGNFSFSGSVTINSPTTGHYAGMSIAFDRNNRSGTPNKVLNGGSVNLDGGLYARQAGFNIARGSLTGVSVVIGGNVDIDSASVFISGSAGGGGTPGRGGIGLWR